MSLEGVEDDFHMDHLDLQILRILADNCRTSYRSIGLTLGLTTNTVKRRVKILIQNKIIGKFITTPWSDWIVQKK
jgi:DNA-binding Lrp family transcriptional regulator